MCKKCWFLAISLALLSAGLAYKFVIEGKVQVAPDSRVTILLEADEREVILAEMRIFLASIQKISLGISMDDMTLITESARLSGNTVQRSVPGSLIGKLPLGFKKLGFDTHAKFDALALDAEQLGDPDHALSQMSTLLNNCVACHAAYRFKVSP